MAGLRSPRAPASGQAGPCDDDPELQEAIRLSMVEYENSQGTKRKAEEYLEPDSARRPSPSANPTIAYPDGALRITRTPGRRNAKNCVNLEDVIHKYHLQSACIFSFFIGDNELYRHLPLYQSSGAVPIYIGRDANMDPMVQEACTQSGISFTNKLSNKQLQTITPKLCQLYARHYGKNYHAFYAWSPGSSHSKILFLVYPDFARIVITSCNMMDIDTVLGDNHWYIHDLPKLSAQTKSNLSSFETDFLAHLQALGTPNAFLDSVRGMYDYSTVKVNLVTSAPGVCSGVKAEKHGLLRLRRVVRDLDPKLPNEQRNVELDICAASIGNLSTKWLNGFHGCAVGSGKIKVAPDDCDVPNLRIFYPSIGDVKKADESAQDAASNIGCHTRPWDHAPASIKNLFHHYESKDTGRLFHQKLILAYNPKSTNAIPYYVYVGSANLSQSAWGALEHDKKSNEATCNTKLVKLSNFECGVVVPGHLIEGLLEAGTESWRDGIVPFVQSAEKYNLAKDRPWNDPRWVQDYQPDWKGN